MIFTNLKKPYFKNLIILLIGISIILFCVYRIGVNSVLEAFGNVKVHFVFCSVVSIFCWLGAGALNIKIMIRPLAKVHYKKIFNIYTNISMASLVIPGQVGDALIVRFFKNMSIPFSQGITIFAIDKFITLFWYSIFAIYGVYLAGVPIVTLCSQMIDGDLIIYVFLMMLFGFFSILYLVVFVFKNRVYNWLSLALEYAHKANGAIVINIILTLVRVIVLGHAYWFMLKAFGIDPPIIHTVCFAVASGMVAYIPISFNGLGTVEATMMYLFHLIGIEPAPVLSAILTIRVFLIVIVCGSATISNLYQEDIYYREN